MTQFISMELSTDLVPVSQAQRVQILSYDRSLHHDQIPQIYAESFEDNPWPDTWDDIEEFDPRGVILAMDESRSELTGFVISFKRRHFGYISVVAVRPKFRRMGIATTLVVQAVQYLKSLGLGKIRIRVEGTNKTAIQVYKKLGFEFVTESEK